MKRPLLILCLLMGACSTALGLSVVERAPPKHHWSVKIHDLYFGVTGDDRSLTLISYGWGSFYVETHFYVVVSVLILIPLLLIVATWFFWPKKSNTTDQR